MSLYKSLVGLSVGLALSMPAQAGILSLVDWGINIDGATHCSFDLSCDLNPTDAFGPNTDAGAFDFGTGLGAIDLSITGAGSHYVSLFVDIEIDQQINTFFNEFGESDGPLGAGQSWEIDEPGFLFGDIVDNFFDGTLDNSNGVPSGSEDDVSLALAWSFDLLAGETASISYLLSQTDFLSGFRLAHFDPDSPDGFVFSSSLTITGGGPGPTPVPEPATLSLVLLGLIGLGLRRKLIVG